MTAVANQVAAEVFKALQTVQYHEWVPLGIAQVEIPIRFRVPNEEDLKWANSVLSRPEGTQGTHIREAIYARRTLDMKKLPEQIPLILQTVRIGDIGIAAMPAEVFVEIGLEIRKRSPFPQTFTISLANGAYGYLPTVEHHKLGGYETWRGTNRLEVQAAPKMIDSLIGLMNDLRTISAQR